MRNTYELVQTRMNSHSTHFKFSSEVKLINQRRRYTDIRSTADRRSHACRVVIKVREAVERSDPPPVGQTACQLLPVFAGEGNRLLK